MLALAMHANDDGVCWPGLDLLRTEIRKSERQTQRLVRDLASTPEVYMQQGVGSGNRTKFFVTVGLPEDEIANVLVKHFEIPQEKVTSLACEIVSRKPREKVTSATQKVTFQKEKVTSEAIKGDTFTRKTPTTVEPIEQYKESSLLFAMQTRRAITIRWLIAALQSEKESEEKEKSSAKKEKPTQPHVAIIEMHYSKIPTEYRPPGKPNISAGCIPAMALLDAGATPDLIGQFMDERYPGYLEWAKRSGATKVMSLEHIRKNFREWLANKAPKQERQMTADDYLRTTPKPLPTPADYGFKS
jgi:hypothetical protein